MARLPRPRVVRYIPLRRHRSRHECAIFTSWRSRHDLVRSAHRGAREPCRHGRSNRCFGQVRRVAIRRVHSDRLEKHQGLTLGHFVQNAPNRMVVAGLKDTSTMTILSWPDSDNNLPAPVDQSFTSISNNWTSTAPDGTDWVNVQRPGNITGAVYRSVAGFGGPGMRNTYSPSMLV